MISLSSCRNISGRLFFGLSLLGVSLQCGFSQAPETFVQALSRHGIALTKPALVDALRNPDKEVRGLAAAELAELKATDTLPEIMRAAQIEQDTLTKTNIAAAATWLGSLDGLNMLKRVCGDSMLSPYARLNAARNVFDKGDHACFSAVADMMLPSEDSGTRIEALYLLSQLRDRTEDESKRILQLLLAALGDRDTHMRLETCQGIRMLHDLDAISSLREAIAKERDELVRTQMQSTLDSLAKPKS